MLRSELYERLGEGDKARQLEAERLTLGLVKQRGESYLHLAGRLEMQRSLRLPLLVPIS